jgi:hypothetical protein
MMADIGHNRGDAAIRVEVRLFNSIAVANGGAAPRHMEIPVGCTLRELAGTVGIVLADVFLVLVNGRDITGGLVGDPVNGARELADGDVVAFSGPVPYSFGYGAPVV